jgi:hypothetical protein
MTIQTEGVGYNDLNDILKDPSDLEFTIGKFVTIYNFVIFFFFVRTVKS